MYIEVNIKEDKVSVFCDNGDQTVSWLIGSAKIYYEKSTGRSLDKEDVFLENLEGEKIDNRKLIRETLKDNDILWMVFQNELKLN